jgi:hypothetical protein
VGMIDGIISWFKADIASSWQVLSAAIGLFAGGLWTALVFFQKVLSEREQKRFDRYRLLIKEINEGRGDDGQVYIAYQLDAVYELRYHRKYYPRTLWLLERLKKFWSANSSYDASHLREIDETIDFIRLRRNLISYVVMTFVKSLRFFEFKKTRL